MSVPNCKLCLSNGLLGSDPVARNAGFFVLSKPHPTNPAAMVVPGRHVTSPFDFTPDE